MGVKGLHKSIFNTSNFWGGGGYVLLAGEMLKTFFENVLLAGEILKKLKMLKMGRTMFVYRCLVHKHGSIFNIFNFLEFPQSEAHFRKSF